MIVDINLHLWALLVKKCKNISVYLKMSTIFSKIIRKQCLHASIFSMSVWLYLLIFKICGTIGSPIRPYQIGLKPFNELQFLLFCVEGMCYACLQAPFGQLFTISSFYCRHGNIGWCILVFRIQKNCFWKLQNAANTNNICNKFENCNLTNKRNKTYQKTKSCLSCKILQKIS